MAARPERYARAPVSQGALDNATAPQLHPLRPEHVDAIVALVLRCDEEWRPWAPPGWQPPPAARERASWLRRFDAEESWVRGALDRDGTLLGVAAWRPAQGAGPREPLAHAAAHLEMLFVDPPAWGRGIGRALLEGSEQAMRAAGYRRGVLNVAERNPARAFYERHGWRAAGPPLHNPGLNLPLVPYEKEL